MAEILKLRQQNKLWMIISGKVYDVSEFKDHPGGFSILEELKGKNATVKFTEAGHPDYVNGMMEKYYVSDVPVIHQDELKHHNKEGDFWLSIHGKVYNVTNFSNHPGGFEILEDHSGKDATQGFEDIDHSASAKQDLENFYVGEYIPGDEVEVRERNFVFIIPLIIIILGIILRKLWE